MDFIAIFSVRSWDPRACRGSKSAYYKSPKRNSIIKIVDTIHLRRNPPRPDPGQFLQGNDMNDSQDHPMFVHTATSLRGSQP
jgi:hypothetical protein